MHNFKRGDKARLVSLFNTGEVCGVLHEMNNALKHNYVPCIIEAVLRFEDFTIYVCTHPSFNDKRNIHFSDLRPWIESEYELVDKWDIA